MPMPGKQARVLCPVCQEPIPPDETECQNCGAFVIDEAVVRLSRAFGLDREKALKLFEAGFRHPKQLRDRDPNRVLEKGEVGLLFICTNCGGFVAGGDSRCPRCSAEFEAEAEEAAKEEEDILDLTLCPVCGADNDIDLVECEICGASLREDEAHGPIITATPISARSAPKSPAMEKALERVDDFLREDDRSKPASIRAPPKTEPPTIVPPKVPEPIIPPSRPDFAEPPVGRSALRPVPRKLTPVHVPPREPRAVEPTRPVRPQPPPTPMVEPPPSAELGAERALETLARIRSTVRASRSIPSTKKRPRPKLPPATRAQTAGMPAELVGGLVLAAAAGLFLATALGQLLVSAGIAAVLIGLCARESFGFLRSANPRPSLAEALLLAAGSFAGIGAVIFREAPVLVPAVLALGAALTFGEATRRLLRSPKRIWLAVASALPIAAQAIAVATGSATRLTIPSILGVLVAIPWPAALAAAEIRRRQVATIVRRDVVMAERDLQRKDYERSLVEYDRAIARTVPDVPGAEVPWYGQGATLILLGRYEEALRSIDRALDINPRSEVAWVNKGNALSRLGRLIDALQCFNAAIKLDPRFEVAWNNKGNALARLGKFEEALPCYERALEIDPGYRGAWVNKGFVLTKMGRFDEAASCADQALRLDRRRGADPVGSA
jgi:tetratricopeptide (TPR) repeat protein